MSLLDHRQGPTGFTQSGTFSAHPIAMAAGLATLRQLTPNAFAHLNAMGDRLRNGLQDLFEQNKQIPARVVGIGSLFGIHFTDEEVADYRALQELTRISFQLFFLPY